MKKAKLLINKSVSGDKTYDVYRFKGQKASINIEDYVKIKPITTIREELVENGVEFGQISDYNPTVIDNGEGYDFKTYTVPFDFLYKNNFVVFGLSNHKNTVAEETVSVYFNKVAANSIVFRKFDGEKYVKYKEITDINEIKRLVVVESELAISLAKSLTSNFSIVTMGINTRRIPYVDLESNGVFKPKLEVIEKIESYDVVQDRSQSNLYYYSIIANSVEGRVSEVSNITAVQLAEDIENLSCVIECSDDYTKDKDKATWNKIDEIPSYATFVIDRLDMYSRDLPNFNIGEFKFDDSNLQSYGERVIMLPNIWHKTKKDLVFRDSRAYRFKNVLNGVESPYSDVFHVNIKNEVKIDKITIYKKRVTNLSEEEKKKPLSPKDSDVEILKMYVRSGGLFYLDAVTNANGRPIQVVSQNSNFPILTIKDSCFYSNEYNYTVYLYDEKGNQSAPYSIIK